MAAMTVTVRLFAILRERAGRDAIELSLPEGATAAEAIEAIRSEGTLGDVIGRLPVRMAINREYAEPDAPLSPGDELALVPPVSGGAEVHVRVHDRPLSLERLSKLVSRPDRLLPGGHPGRSQARVRGLRRDGGGADGIDSR
jgi:molybdopterin converting factor subunit 1